MTSQEAFERLLKVAKWDALGTLQLSGHSIEGLIAWEKEMQKSDSPIDDLPGLPTTIFFANAALAATNPKKYGSKQSFTLRGCTDAELVKYILGER